MPFDHGWHAEDLGLRSGRGAVTVEVDHAPHVYLDVDLHVGGTLARPALSGQARRVGLCSTVVLALKRSSIDHRERPPVCRART